MMSITHWDGAEVVVLDARGRFMGAIDVVRVEPDRALVALKADKVDPALPFAESPRCAIHSLRDGRLHFCGPVRFVLVLDVTHPREGPMTMEHACPALELRSIDPVRRRARRYHISECESLFGEPGLLIAWGRIGRQAQVRLETFATLSKQIARRNELLARRSAHGYQPYTTATAEHKPLTEERRSIGASETEPEATAGHMSFGSRKEVRGTLTSVTSQMQFSVRVHGSRGSIA